MGTEQDSNRFEETRPFVVLSPGTLISHYRIVEKIGEGGMGVVYKAVDTKLDRKVALKFLLPQMLCDTEARTRFQHEAKAASALNHPNIATIHEIDEFEGHTFIVMECVGGLSLKDKMRSGPVGIEEAVDIAAQVGEGLREAHDNGIVHRDIKSGNIIVTPKGQAKITDFGLAKIAGATTVTQPGTVVGTAAYMSPEQARGHSVDRRTDIWSLGVLMYEMVTGRLPFRAEHSGAVIHSILNSAPEPVTSLRSGVPMEFERTIAKAMEKQPAKRYQTMEDLLVDLRNLRDKRPPTANGTGSAGRTRARRLLVPAGILALAAVVLAVVMWTQIGRQPAAVAAENVLAVMYFDNLADPEDPEKTGEIATSLLITDLSESQYIRVVSSQRLYDVLKLIGREGVKKIDRSVAGEVAQKAGARWMLLGSILQVTPHIEIATQLVEVSTGQVRASQRVAGEPGQKIFSLIDKLTAEVKTDLSLPGAAKREKDPLVADVTTSSPEAYRYYVEGLEYSNKTYYVEAIASLRKAIERDSTFAMAYYRLWNETSYTEAKEFLAKAVKYSRKASRKERAYIKYAQAAEASDFWGKIRALEEIVQTYPDEKEAFYHLGFYYQDINDGEASIRAFRRAIEIDPLYKLAYNALAYAYHEMGDFEKSMWAINDYISLVPAEANPYDSRGDLYAWSGKIDDAIESYKKAIQINPEYTNMRLGHMYLFLQQYDKAEECYRRLLRLDTPLVRSWGRYSLAIIPAYRGRFQEALEILDAGISADKMENMEGFPVLAKRALKAEIHVERGETDLALGQAEARPQDAERLLPETQLALRSLRAEILAKAGRFKEAEDAVRALKNETSQQGPVSLRTYWSQMGEMELARGNARVAIEWLEKAARERFSPEFSRRMTLAEAYLMAGRLDAAVGELEAALRRYDDQRAEAPVQAVKAYHLLGLAYEASGWTDRAAEQYEEFLKIWKDADPGIPCVEDARQRLARLKEL